MKTATIERKKPQRPIERHVGMTYIAFRKGHAWHGREVAVFEKRGGKCKCVLAERLWAAFDSPRSSPKRKVKTETFTEEELW